uniref:ImpB/MucB/SamB family protein n=1 Tax=Anisakis simplex TaxID=6269 RepID=A0A0M3JMA8_ANISI
LNAFDSRIIVERASVDEAFLDLTQLVDYIVDSETPSLKYSTSLDMFPTTHIADGRDVNASDAPDWHYDREANLREWLNRACSGERNLVRSLVC